MRDEDWAALADSYATILKGLARALRSPPLDGVEDDPQGRAWAIAQIQAIRFALNGVRTEVGLYRLAKMRLISMIETSATTSRGSSPASAAARALKRHPEFAARLTPEDVAPAIAAWQRRGRPPASEAKAARKTKWDVIRELIRKAGLPLSEGEELKREYALWKAKQKQGN